MSRSDGFWDERSTEVAMAERFGRVEGRTKAEREATEQRTGLERMI